MSDLHNSYSAIQSEGETMRETEARALLNCARRLDAACDPECDYDTYVAAIQHNQRLWTIFQISITEPDNPLPLEIKRNLLNLSLYVDKTSFQAIAARSPQKLRSLININRNIAEGLSMKPETQIDNAEEPEAKPQPTTQYMQYGETTIPVTQTTAAPQAQPQNSPLTDTINQSV